MIILHQSAGYVAVAKPPGTLVIPGRGAEERTLRTELEEQLSRPVWVVHRLDRDTSGVLLFALDARTHRTLSMAFEGREMEKRYLALVAGRWEEDVEIDLPLVAARRGRSRPARTDETGKAARTDFRPLELFAQATWVEARPLTGRMHQIRVHARAAGHPLLVDPHYGEPGPLSVGAAVLSRTPLHAASLRVPKLPDLEPADISAPVPEDLAVFLTALRSNPCRVNTSQVNG